MPERLAAAALQDILRDFLDARHGDKEFVRKCSLGKDLEKDAQRRRDKAFLKMQDAFKRLHGYKKHSDEVDLRIPKCMDKKTLCDFHYHVYKKLRDQHGHELFSDLSTRPKTQVDCDSSDSKAIYGDDDDGEASNEVDHSEYNHSDHNHSDHDHSDRNGHVDGNDSMAMLAESDGSPDEEEDFEEIIYKDAVTKTRKMHMTVYTDGTRALTRIPAEDSKQDGVTASDDERAPSSDHPTSTRHTKVPDVNSRSGNAFLTPEKAVAKLQLSPGSTERGSNLRERYIKASERKRARKALVKLEADGSYDEPVAANEAEVRDLIRLGPGFNSAEKGTIYAMRDEELGLVKIGWTGSTAENRRKGLIAKCNIIGEKLKVLVEIEATSHRLLETIIHRDLQPHRWFHHCHCGKKNRQKFTRHKEWFDIDDVTAVRTIKLWADFFKQHPWGPPTYGATVCLTTKWAAIMAVSSIVDESEEHDHHEMRDLRWRTFLGLEIKPDKGVINLAGLELGDFTPSKQSSVPAELPLSPSDQELSSDEINEIPIKLERNKSFKSQLHAAKKNIPFRECAYRLAKWAVFGLRC